MNDPRQVAASIVGAVDWQTEVSGFCRCPGEALHTQQNGKKDCRVSVDGAPTIYCFHASCSPVVAEANRRLRRELGDWSWEIALPGGRVLRNGDVLQASGEVLPREAVQARARAEGRDGGEQVILETVRVMAERFAPEMFERFHWPFAQIVADSPLQVSERDAEDQFRTWLKLWPAHCHVWIGDVFSSGKPEHRTHFRPIADWYQIGPCMGNFTCGSAFKPGSFRRCNENLNGQRFLVIESDTLAKDEVGAVFAYLNRRLRYRLHCIIDTAGKSLHAWFDAPRNRTMEARLKAGLTAFGCDPKVFTYSQPVRVPGAWRDGKLQRLVWLKE
ncbi:MAG: hypothetical protein EPO07_11525 [Verrucomicrobia bacterium]|nr:MAG: hypothetical protein EPO07_11525 [Verrucomicrobiota bacterium]